MNRTENTSVEPITTANSFSIELFLSYNEYKAAIFIWKVFPPIMIVFGTIGNILSIKVLTRRNIRGTNSFVFLTVLAVSDTMVLYSGLLRQWILYTFEVDIRHVHPMLCKTNIFFVYFTLQFSAWLLVLVTFDRVFATWFPHSFIGKVSHWIPITTASVLAVILIALNAHFFHGFEDLQYQVGNETIVQSCVRKDNEYRHFSIEIWPWIDLVVFNLLPFLLLLIGSALIFIKVFQNRKALMTKIAPVSGRLLSLSKTLIILNTAFLLLNTPSSIYLAGQTTWYDDINEKKFAVLNLVWAMVNILTYSNNTINFLLYCLSGSKFRQELMKIFSQLMSFKKKQTFNY
ncbi:hypothetical protein KUTeg_010976 [Tegillarca granosa]|uniref:G-protein coupled receptors family 1 profile domain-containing protein n=1 Tax=Tegillarca granosa TaxID=220873 RepID=A0ABQ9F5Y3_TEGGR|nr:hypothetical protein KUTeg_010976 [Tegillarca granosa]